MNKLAMCLSGLSLLITSPVMSADMRMPVKAPAPVAVASYNWTGCYVGANVGFGWAHKSFSDPAEGVVDATERVSIGSHTADGFVGGGQLGCDFQTGQWVFGLQGMFDWADLDGSNPLPIFNFGPTDGVYTTVRWFATVTGRVGFTVQPNLLAYVKGGGAWVRDKFLVITDGGGVHWTSNVTRGGWTIGGGLEWLFLPQWSVFAEYNYMNFGTEGSVFASRLIFRPVVDIKQDVQTVLLGINYRFNR